jgi:hypothetical protein
MALRASSRRSRFAFRGRPGSVASPIAYAIWRKVPEDAWPAYQAPSRAIARELAAGMIAAMAASTIARLSASWMTSKPASPICASHDASTGITNLLERLFVEERHRLKIIPNAFGDRAVLKLKFGRSSALPSDGALSRSPSSNAGRWLSEKNSIRNTRPRRPQCPAVKGWRPSKNKATLRLHRKVGQARFHYLILPLLQMLG